MINIRQNNEGFSPLRSIGATLFLVGLFVVGGCDLADSTKPQVVAKLSCGDGDGSTTECVLDLPQGGGFTVTLESVSCTAPGNRVRLTMPVQFAQSLTSDGCAETPPRTWNIGGSLAPGAKLAIEVESARLKNPSQLRVSGDYPEWLIEFEDGGDQDFNDLVFRVRANPPA